MRGRSAALALVVALPACGAFTAVGIGSDDPDVPEGATPVVGDGGVPEGGGGDGGGSSLDSGAPDGSGACALGTPDHCGVCGHSCNGTKCVGNQCEAERVTSSGAVTNLSVRGGTLAWVEGASAGWRCNTASCVPTSMPYGAIDRLVLLGPSRAVLSQATQNLVTAVDWSAASNQSIAAAGGAAAFAVEGATVFYAEKNAPNVYRGAPGIGAVLVARNEAVRGLATQNATLYVAFAGTGGLGRFDPPLGGSPVPVELPSIPRVDTGAIAAVVTAGNRPCWLKGTTLRCDPGGALVDVVPTGVTAIASDGPFVYYASNGKLSRIRPDGKGGLDLVKLGASVVVDALAPGDDGWLYFAVTDGPKLEIRRVAK